MLKTIKSNRINVHREGKITTGIKAKTSEGKEYPKATDYFVVDDFPELIEVYGQKPSKLVVVFPTNVIDDFLNADMVLYGSNNAMIRKCDSVECTHRIDEELDFVGKYNEEGEVEETEPHKRKFSAGEIGECICKIMPETIERNNRKVRNPKLCSCAMYLKAFVVDYKVGKIISPLCYLFYSGSENTASNIYSELVKIHNMFNGRIAGLPFGLSVDMVAGRTNAKIKYPIWNIQALGTMAQLQKAGESFLFDYKEMLISQGDKKKELTEGDKKEPDDYESLRNPSPEDLTSPQYYIDVLGVFESKKTLNDWFEKRKFDLDFFDIKDKERIEEAKNKRLAELK